MRDRSFLWRETKTCHSCNRSLSKLSPNRFRLHFLWQLSVFCNLRAVINLSNSNCYVFIIGSAYGQIKCNAQQNAEISMNTQAKFIRFSSLTCVHILELACNSQTPLPPLARAVFHAANRAFIAFYPSWARTVHQTEWATTKSKQSSPAHCPLSFAGFSLAYF